MPGSPTWVNLLASAPTKPNFATTGGLGTPINIDKSTGFGYYLDKDTPKILGQALLGYATRADLAAAPHSVLLWAYLTEAGAEGDFVWSSANLQTSVTADPNKAIFVPPTGQNGSTGAWVRKFYGAAISTWWGVKTTANGGTGAGNVSAMNAAEVTLKFLGTTGYGYNTGSIGLYTPAGIYPANAEIVLDHAYDVFGDFTGAGGGTVWVWSSNTSGFGLRGDAGHSNGAHLRNMVLVGTNAGANCHAVNQLGYGLVSDLYVTSWSGDAIYANGVPPSGLSGSRWSNVLADAVGWTLHIDGGDSNGCQSIGIGCGANRFGGILDSSGIGCRHFPGVINGCGNVVGYATHCVYLGKGYSVAYG